MKEITSWIYSFAIVKETEKGRKREREREEWYGVWRALTSHSRLVRILFPHFPSSTSHQLTSTPPWLLEKLYNEHVRVYLTRTFASSASISRLDVHVRRGTYSFVHEYTATYDTGDSPAWASFAPSAATAPSCKSTGSSTDAGQTTTRNTRTLVRENTRVQSSFFRLAALLPIPFPNSFLSNLGGSIHILFPPPPPPFLSSRNALLFFWRYFCQVSAIVNEATR